MTIKLPILTCILIGMRISAAQLPQLPSEIVQEIRTHASHADNLDVAAQNILNFLQVNKKMSAEYTKNPKEFIHNTIQVLAQQFNVDPIVAAAYLSKNKYALEFFRNRLTHIHLQDMQYTLIIQMLKNFNKSTFAFELLLNAIPNPILPSAYQYPKDIIHYIDFYKKTGILVNTSPELITINDKKIPMIGCRTIAVNGILERKNNFLLFGTCLTTDSSTLVLILLFNREGTVENMFTFKVKRIQIDSSNIIPIRDGPAQAPGMSRFPPVIGPKSPANSPANTPPP